MCAVGEVCVPNAHETIGVDWPKMERDERKVDRLCRNPKHQAESCGLQELIAHSALVTFCPTAEFSEYSLLVGIEDCVAARSVCAQVHSEKTAERRNVQSGRPIGLRQVNRDA